MMRGPRSTCLFDGVRLRAIYTEGASSELVVTFDHWRRDRSGFPSDRDGAFWSEKGLSHLDIQSSRNDWFFNDELNDLTDALQEVVQAAGSVRSIGFSMGAYGALLLSEVLGASCTLLSSPQSGAPYYTHDDPWSRDYANACARGLLDLTPIRALTGAAILLYDPKNATDAYHARKLGEHNPVVMIARPGAGHPAAFYARQPGAGLRKLLCDMSAGAMILPGTPDALNVA